MWAKIPFKQLLFVLLMVAIGEAGWVYYTIHKPLRLPNTPFEFTVQYGGTLKGFARQMKEAGLLRHPTLFVMMARLMNKSGQIKAGSYLLDQNLNSLELLAKVTSGDTTLSEIRFIEGNTFAQMRKVLAAHPGVKNETAGLPDAQVLARIGAMEAAAEGIFYPNTYWFSSGMSDVAILKRAYKAMQVALAGAWNKRQPGLPLNNAYEALIVASIIEKETAVPQERQLIAAVFINRLRLGMRLQTDPTVIYGLGEKYDGRLGRTHLTTDTVYNTYTRAGLPPTPIAMPGIAAIEAALHPADTPVLYFVSKGNGTHHFSTNLDEHNNAVNRYQRGQ